MAENDDNHSNHHSRKSECKNGAYNSFLGTAELSTLSLSTMEVKSFDDGRDTEEKNPVSKNCSYFVFEPQ